MDCHGLRGLAKTGGEESVKSIKHAPWPSRRDFTGVVKSKGGRISTTIFLRKKYMDKNHKIAMIIVVIVVGTGAFFGGMKYAESQRASQFAARGVGAGQGSGMGVAGRAGGQRGAGAGAVQNGGAGDFASGQVMAKDDTSITLKTRNGSSQIVFFAPSTTIDKAVVGAGSDLSVGQQVMANGKNNPDGSLAATSIQIRPDTPANQ